MGFFRKLLGRKSKSTTSSSQGQSSSSAQEPTTFVSQDPFPNDEAFEAVRAHFMAQAHDPRIQAIMRQTAFSVPMAFLSANFPPEQGHVFCEMGPFPHDIRVDEETVIPQDDTRIHLVGRQATKNTKGKAVVVSLVALPPKGTGEGESAGTPMARGTLGTPAINAAEKALLAFMRDWQENGIQGSRIEDGVIAIVSMGVDMLIYEYSREKGFFDPPGGFEFRTEKVDLGWDESDDRRVESWKKTGGDGASSG